MTLADALQLRRQLGDGYVVRRSSVRSLGVTPFYVAVGR